MSKSFSGRFRAWACAAAIAALAAGCGRQENNTDGEIVRATTVVEPEMRVDDVPQEEPGLARNRWRVANAATRDVAGNLSASLESGRGGPLALAFANGVTLRAEILTVHPADTRVSNAGAYANLMGLDPRVEVNVYRVSDERVAPAAPRGGLCGEARTQHVAVVEFVDEDGDWTMKIAAFRGRAAPGESATDPELCGVYIYQAP